MSLFDLSAKITLDSKGYERGITEATTKGQKLAGFLKSGLGTAAKVGGAALAAGATAAASGIVALTGSAVKNYAQYEQLVGGVETLFGAGGKSLEEYAESVGKTVDEAQSEYDTLMKSQNMMMDNASKAYKTAGMSANEYMENVTGFSAAMLQSLGGDTVAAAEYADMAMQDMSDNANKMGTDINSIVMTYQSLSRGNFAMLDNLKLGYGGTKEELERLIADAAALDSTVKAGDMSFANIAQAIHVVQNEMGITGTTAKEAATTIEGSVNTMKASWTNLTTGLADENANIDQLMDEFIDSVGAVADNIIPVVERIVSNISGKLVENFPKISQKGGELLAKLAVGIVKAIPEMLKAIPKVIDAIIEGFKKADVDWLDIGKNVVMGIFDGIGSMVAWANEKIFGFVGGIVSKVKEKLGIHSPSKVFAEIGGYMAEGVGEGWEGEYDNIKSRIAKDMDFETGRIGFSDSGIGVSSAQIINNAQVKNENVSPMILNLVLPDGSKLASYMFDSLANYGAANGTPILNPT